MAWWTHIPQGVNAKVEPRSLEGEPRELISRGNHANVDLIGREWPGEVVWGVEGKQADIPHGEHGNVLGSGEVLEARGAPGDYSQGEETEDYRQTERAGLQGKREGRVLICREILNKGLCRNSHREHAQWRLIAKVVGPRRSTDSPGFTYNSPKLMYIAAWFDSHWWGNRVDLNLLGSFCNKYCAGYLT